MDEIDTGAYRAYFGYRLEYPVGVSVPIGADNRFWPGEVDRGQPTEFITGYVPNAFYVDFDGRNLFWVLDERVVRVSRRTERCCPEKIDICGVCGGAGTTMGCEGGSTTLNSKGFSCGSNGRECPNCLKVGLSVEKKRVRRAFKKLYRITKVSNRLKAKALFDESRTILKELPRKTLACSAPTPCGLTDQRELLDTYRSNAKEILRIALPKVTGAKQRRAKRAARQVDARTKRLPRFVSVCE